MNTNFNKSILFGLLIVLISSCKKEDLTPTEKLIGKWQLVAIQGSDTTYNTHNGITSIKRIVTFSYNNNPLVITYDSITHQRETSYNFLCQLEFIKDGKLIITEEYRDLQNNPLVITQRTTSWHKDPFAMNPYTYYLWIYEEYIPYSPDNSKIFLHPIDPIDFDDQNVSNHQLILQDKDKNNGHWNTTFTFKKI